MTEPNNNIADLSGPMVMLALEFEYLIKERNLKAKIYETRRSKERQAELFNLGYSKIKSGGMHEYGMAFDVVFEGKKPWDNSHPWDKLGQIGHDLGLYWGGDWHGFVDRPHFQYIPATVTEQDRIRQGYMPPMPFPTLHIGHRGPQVVILQQGLRLKNYPVKLDGIFGNNTKDAVIQYQKSNHLTGDGVCRWGLWKAFI